MRPAPLLSWSDPRNERFRRRAASLALAVAVHVLLLLLLLRIAPPLPPPRPPAARSVLLDLLPEKQASADSSKAEEAKRETTKPTPARRELVVPEPVVALPPTAGSAAADAIWSKVIPLTRQELADADSTLSKGRDASRPEGDPGGRQSASAQSVGTGPNGQPLFAADWYRPPTDAELAPYLPAGAPREGWGMIACQTVPGFRVDNCSAIGQHPPGSGLATAVLNASWQFRVLPPRIGGRPMVGAWVRIRIDYTRRSAG